MKAEYLADLIAEIIKAWPWLLGLGCLLLTGEFVRYVRKHRTQRRATQRRLDKFFKDHREQP